jgi:predicted house-cleaning noncanonical NTP pyrophosphatase (MazG superfamily)
MLISVLIELIIDQILQVIAKSLKKTWWFLKSHKNVKGRLKAKVHLNVKVILNPEGIEAMTASKT